ncbi:MAG: dihydrolipoamide acetyltransferase family protein [Deltaproteobacteria bacterium]
MAIEVVVPRLGWSMDEGTFGEWLKQDGELVRRGEALFVLEGEKSAQDIESFDEGILRIPPDAPQPGDTVKVGQVLAFLVAKGEAAPIENAPRAGAGAKPQATAKAATAETTPVAGEAKRAHAESSATSSGAKASPRARRRAQQAGVDLTTVHGTGSTGRIRERDVIAAAKSQARRATAARTAPTTEPWRSTTAARRTLAVSPFRRTIASRMSAGAHETAAVTLTTRCDATNLVNLRDQFRAAERGAAEAVPSYNELLVKLTAMALEHHPLLAAQWSEREILLPDGLHISVAVDTEAGLLAPVVRDADKLTLRQIAAELRRLVDLARDGGLSAEQMQGGVFTITNLGMFKIDSFTPIINLPQCAILGVGRIAREPAVVNDQIVPRDLMTLSLTFDHRVVDGAPAARFLNDLRLAIEHPAAALVP